MRALETMTLGFIRAPLDNGDCWPPYAFMYEESSIWAGNSVMLTSKRS